MGEKIKLGGNFFEVNELVWRDVRIVEGAFYANKALFVDRDFTANPPTDSEIDACENIVVTTIKASNPDFSKDTLSSLRFTMIELIAACYTCFQVSGLFAKKGEGKEQVGELPTNP